MYTVDGFADYDWRGHSRDPLSSRVEIRRCTSCSYAVSEQAAAGVINCPVCGAAVRASTMFQPGGFRAGERTDRKTDEYLSTSASRPVLGWVEAPAIPLVSGPWTCGRSTRASC